GDVVAVGTNEAPKAGGGQYWPGDDPDGRDFQSGEDQSRLRIRALFADIMERLKEHGWLAPVRQEQNIDELVNEALFGAADIMGDARIRDLMEFMRPVHAEMAALIDAAKRGVSVKGCTLYSTTFPCHECA